MGISTQGSLEAFGPAQFSANSPALAPYSYSIFFVDWVNGGQFKEYRAANILCH